MNNLLAKLQIAYEADVPLMVWGVPGVAKTAIINQWANKVLNMRMITLHLSQMEAPDLLGLPKALMNGGKENGMGDNEGNLIVHLTKADIESYKTHYVKPAWWPDEKVILFMDELNRAGRFEINAVHQLVLEKRLFMNVLPKGSFVVSACNPQTQEEIGLTPFGDAFWDRWAHVQVRTSPEAWVNWAGRNGIDGSIIDFIESQPQSDRTLTLNSRTMKFEDVLKNVHPTPRSWEMVSRVVKACHTFPDEKYFTVAGQPIIEGLVGRTTAHTFFSFLASSEKPIAPEEIMAYTRRKILVNSKNPAMGTRDSNPADDFEPGRVDQKVREKLERWGKRGDNKIALLKATVKSAGELVLKTFNENGGADIYTKNIPKGQVDFGNFFQLLTDVPPSVWVSFLQEIAGKESWDQIILLANFSYVEQWAATLTKTHDGKDS